MEYCEKYGFKGLKNQSKREVKRGVNVLILGQKFIIQQRISIKGALKMGWQAPGHISTCLL
jgi:hypothetical protein